MKVIKLKNEFGNNILTRNSMAAFFRNRIDSLKDNEITLDFKGIRFISRSCAAEYLKLRENSDKILIEKNMSDEIKFMFRLVINQLRNVNFNVKKKIQLIN